MFVMPAHSEMPLIALRLLRKNEAWPTKVGIPQASNLLLSPWMRGILGFNCLVKLVTRVLFFPHTSSTPVPSICARSTQDGSNTTLSLFLSAQALWQTSVPHWRLSLYSPRDPSSTTYLSICKRWLLRPHGVLWRKRLLWREY